MISIYYTASHGNIVSSIMIMSMKPSRKLQSLRDFFKHASSESQPTTSAPTPASKPSTKSLAGVNAFENFIDGVEAPQPVATAVYNGSKILLDVIDEVGYAVPPLKAAAAGIRRIMTVVDVCTSRRLATAM